jgi:hypothetical protein
MNTALKFGLCLTCLSLPASANQWTVTSGTDTQKSRYASMSIHQDDILLELSCTERGQVNSTLSMTLLTPSLPNLQAHDDAKAKLIFEFTLNDGSSFETYVASHYFDGGPGDQAWVGKLAASPSSIDALAAATSVKVRAPDRTPVLSFSAKGTAKGARAIRDYCGIGLTW